MSTGDVGIDETEELCRLLENQGETLRKYRSGAGMHKCLNILNGIVNLVPVARECMEDGDLDQLAEIEPLLRRLHGSACAFISRNRL